LPNPDQITVTVKTVPVKVTMEDKGSFFLVKGNYPNHINNTVARVDIRVKSDLARCSAEDGWLIKITE
jgi:hypothetical protein